MILPSQQSVAHGVVEHTSARPTDYLYRVSLKCLIVNERDEVLVVKESGRTYWDLPGGGMEHDEDLRTAIAREMHEEVSMVGDFTYRILTVDEPIHLEKHNLWQLRLIFAVRQDYGVYSPGDDSDAMQFIAPDVLKQSSQEVERRVYNYYKLL